MSATTNKANNQDVITLFAIVGLAAALVGDILGMVFGKLPGDAGAILAGELATFLAGVSAYYLMD